MKRWLQFLLGTFGLWFLILFMLYLIVGLEAGITRTTVILSFALSVMIEWKIDTWGNDK